MITPLLEYSLLLSARFAEKWCLHLARDNGKFDYRKWSSNGNQTSSRDLTADKKLGEL
jgi:hypothetical protein